MKVANGVEDQIAVEKIELEKIDVSNPRRWPGATSSWTLIHRFAATRLCYYGTAVWACCIFLRTFASALREAKMCPLWLCHPEEEIDGSGVAHYIVLATSCFAAGCLMCLASARMYAPHDISTQRDVGAVDDVENTSKSTPLGQLLGWLAEDSQSNSKRCVVQSVWSGSNLRGYAYLAFAVLMCAGMFGQTLTRQG
jgi:hypothetical protein